MNEMLMEKFVTKILYTHLLPDFELFSLKFSIRTTLLGHTFT